MNGMAGDDDVRGGEGNDQIDGGAGNDALSGGQGNDTINGGAGNDTIIGGEGADKMIGGAGEDVFRYQATKLGADDMAGGVQDVIVRGKGDLIDLSDAVEEMLIYRGIDLSETSQTVKIGAGGDGSNVAFFNNTLWFDTNHDGAFDAGHDFSIMLEGAKGVIWDGANQHFDIV
jgi:Ca2+-binding RTX toxin-like protein